MEEIKLTHDGQLAIATAYSRKASKWKNGETTWSQFLQRLNKPTETSETVAEYKQMNREQQGAIKDVGGFVAGHLKEGKRTAGNVLARSMLTLDADHLEGGRDYWDEFQLLFDHGMAIYSTHSHTENAPRLRIIIPLSRPVSAEEYTPLARRVAETFGIEIFDVTTYQPERLMYWPSHARKGSYIFNHVDAPWLNPDDVLATYEDWRDSSFWPTSSKETEVRKRERKKAGDPVEKPGIIGAFCRTYDIQSAIETFLPGVYEPTRQKDRYTYAGGSTAGGLVIYDDAFAYSHHSTDPIGENLVNAFDLVRIHLFGDKDQEAKSGTPVNRLPSSTAMRDFVMKDEKVRVEIVQSKIGDAISDFEGEFEEKDVSLDWLSDLTITKSGEIINSITNLKTILKNDPRLKGLIGFNEFSLGLEKRKRPVWESKFDKQFQDRDESEIQALIDAEYKLTPSEKSMKHALVTEAYSNSFHPVKEFIEKEEWDGQKRIGRVLQEYLGAEDSHYTTEISELWFAAAVSRIYNPGCKWDQVLTAIGPQGVGKSTLFRKLAGDEWFTDNLSSMRSKDDSQTVMTNWVLELSELSATKKTDQEEQKSFISRVEDVVRLPYAKNITRAKRKSVFVGTTNIYTPLKDLTGGRRWLIFYCGRTEAHPDLFNGKLDAVIPQLWAEAKVLAENKYKLGYSLILSPESRAVALEMQQGAQEVDPFIEDIEEYLNVKIPKNFYDMSQGDRRNYIQQALKAEEFETDFIKVPLSESLVQRDMVSAREIAFELPEYPMPSTDHRLNGMIKKIGMYMGNHHGWERKKYRIPGSGKQVKGYVRIPKKNGTDDF